MPVTDRAYAGPPELSALTGLTRWTLDLPVLIAVLLLAVGYGLGVWRLRGRGTRWPVRDILSFYLLGLGSIVLATMSSLGAYDRVLFWPNAVQVVVLHVLTPVFMAFGNPVALGAAVLPSGVVAAVGRSRVLRVLTLPFVSSLLGLVVMLTLYLTPYYSATLHHPWLQQLLRLELVAAGALFFWPMLADRSLPGWCTYPVRAVFAFVDSLIDAIPGIVVMTAHSLIAGDYYRSVVRNWGPSLHWDQTIAGATIISLSEVVGLPFLVAIVFAWFHHDERTAAAADRALDAELLARTPADAEPALLQRPWWEVDPGPLAERRPPRPNRERRD